MVRVGIDIGGTGIQIGAVNNEKKIVSKGDIVSRPDLPFSEQVRQIAECVISTVKEGGFTPDEIEMVGVGIPGIATPDGIIINCSNLGWYDSPFRKEFVKYLNKPVLIDNDANVAALAESVAGISAGSSSSVFVTIGTGIGSGIVLNSRIWSGAHGIGGELGHTVLVAGGLPCTCGSRGCLERYCSATAIIRMGREAMAGHPESLIWQQTNGNPDLVNARIVIDAARSADPVAEQVYRQFVSYLSMAISNIVNFLDPEVIVLGGGVSKAGAFLLDAVRNEFPQYVIFRNQPLPRLELAILGSDAGIIGAAMLS